MKRGSIPKESEVWRGCAASLRAVANDLGDQPGAKSPSGERALFAIRERIREITFDLAQAPAVPHSREWPGNIW